MNAPELERHGRRALRAAAIAAALLSILAPSAALPAAAQPDPAQAAPAPLPPGTALYAVEIVVFRATSVAATEDWTVAPTPRGFGSSGTQPGLDPQVVRMLSPSEYRLNGVVDGLRRNGVWRPIAHAGWVQNAPNWGSHIGLPLATVGVTLPGLTGLVYLERAPLYLHLGFDVALQEGATYTIDEMHNVRQNEKEYFDHPAFGIIAVVSPVRAPAGHQ